MSAAEADSSAPRARRANVVLIGARGSGKSVLGRALAERLDREFVDTDELIGLAAGCSADEWLAREGERRFRELEAAALEQAATRSGAVVATGGGSVTCGPAFARLAQSGVVLWLQAGEETLRRRARSRPRPPLAGLPPEEDVLALARLRAPLYAAAAQHVVSVDVGDPILAALSALGPDFGEGCAPD